MTRRSRPAGAVARATTSRPAVASARPSTSIDGRPSTRPALTTWAGGTARRPASGRGRLNPLDLEPSRLPAFEREDRDGDPARAVPGDERRIAAPFDDRSIDLGAPGPAARTRRSSAGRSPTRIAPVTAAPRGTASRMTASTRSRGGARNLHREVGAHGPRLRRHARGELSQQRARAAPLCRSGRRSARRRCRPALRRGEPHLGRGGLVAEGVARRCDRRRAGSRARRAASVSLMPPRTAAPGRGSQRTFGRERCPVARSRSAPSPSSPVTLPTAATRRGENFLVPVRPSSDHRGHENDELGVGGWVVRGARGVGMRELGRDVRQHGGLRRRHRRHVDHHFLVRQRERSMLDSQCPSATASSSGLTITGSITYNADGTYSLDLHGQRIHPRHPASLLPHVQRRDPHVRSAQSGVPEQPHARPDSQLHRIHELRLHGDDHRSDEQRDGDVHHDGRGSPRPTPRPAGQRVRPTTA